MNFFVRDPPAHAVPALLLPPELQFHSWQPELDGRPTGGSRRASNHFWWALAKAGAFARPGFVELRIQNDGQLLHRLIVTPAWYRFPFMAREDLQIGEVWTSPDARRKQLARAAIAEAHRRFADGSARFWYVTDANNFASGELARSCGYRLVATGRRTRRLGTSLLGQYVIDRYV